VGEHHYPICQVCLDKANFADNLEMLKAQSLEQLSYHSVNFGYLYALFSRFSEGRDYLNPVRSLKYRSQTKIGVTMGYQLGEKIIEEKGEREYDLVVPLPIHNARRRERGFNQSEYIAEGVAAVLNIPMEVDGVARAFYTQTQTSLDSKKRTINVSKAFKKTDSELVKDKRILLVDDVFTTGATMNSAASALMENNAKYVDAAVLIISSN